MPYRNKPDRSSLEFQVAVRKHFRFLETEYGYKCVYSDPNCVKFTSDKTYFNIYHEKISYEMYIRTGILSVDSNNILEASLTDIILDQDIDIKNAFYQASNKKSVNISVASLANLIKMYGEDALKGSMQYFKVIAHKRLKRQNQLQEEEELKLMEERAEKAWNNKNYKAVIEAYGSIENSLNDVQLKKFKVAKKIQEEINNKN